MEECELKARFDAFLKDYRARYILEDIGELQHPFTRAMVTAAETREVAEESRMQAMLGILGELESFCHSHKDKIEPAFHKFIASNIACARNDMERGDLYSAISDVNYVESWLPGLQDELSRMQAPDVRKYLLGRIAESGLRSGGTKAYVIVE